jgi:aminoglycoside phosphotransferase (APT) family kinase protein
LGGDGETRLVVRQFPGGYSNLTYLVCYGERELVLRRPPIGSKVRSAHDMGREFRILSRLAPVFPRAPQPVGFCDDEALLGAKFYVMERISGLILRQKLPTGIDLGPSVMSALCEAFLDTLVELHAIDAPAVGLGDLGHPEGYVERQVSGWAKRYRDAQTDEVPAIERVVSWLSAHLPPSPPPTLIHNDYKFDNLVLDPSQPTRIIGVLDWEMATLGDPLMDLGTALCYWVQADDPPQLHAAAFGPTTRPGCPTRQQLADRYAARSGRDLRHIVFYYCFGLFKTAVVVQQIYYRFKQGLTSDPRFAMLGAMAQLLAEQADRTIDRQHI